MGGRFKFENRAFLLFILLTPTMCQRSRSLHGYTKALLMELPSSPQGSMPSLASAQSHTQGRQAGALDFLPDILGPTVRSRLSSSTPGPPSRSQTDS